MKTSRTPHAAARERDKESECEWCRARMRTRIIHAHIGAQSTATTRRRPRPPHPSFHSPEPLPRLPHSPSRRACSTRGDDRAAHCWRLSLFGLSCSPCLSVVLAICPFSTRVAHTCTRGERPLFALSQRPFPAPPQPRRGEPAHHTAAPGAGALTGSCRALASFLKLRLKRRMRHARLASLFRVRGPTVPYPRTSSSARERALLQASFKPPWQLDSGTVVCALGYATPKRPRPSRMHLRTRSGGPGGGGEERVSRLCSLHAATAREGRCGPRLERRRQAGAGACGEGRERELKICTG